MPAVAARLPKALTPDELEALRAVRMNRRDQALLEILAGCGLRVSEACNLRLDEVLWTTTATPSLRFTGKRGRERVVPMHHQVQEALQAWLESRGIRRSDYVFCNLRTGGRLSRKTVWDAFRRHSRHAGLRPVHPHMLRHTFGTSLADRAVPIERIRELMGHASIQTSQLYIAVSAAQKWEAVQRLDRRHPLVRWLSRRRTRAYRFWGQPRRLPTFSPGQTVGRHHELQQLQTHLAKGIDTLLVGPAGVGKSHLLALLDSPTLIRLPSLSPPRQVVIQLAEELHHRGVSFVSPRGGEATDRTCSHPREGEPSAPTPDTVPGTPGGASPVTPVSPAPGSASGSSASPILVTTSPAATIAAAPSAPSALTTGAAAGTSFTTFQRQHQRTGLAEWTRLVLAAASPGQWTLVIDDLSDLTPTTARLLDRLSTGFTIIAALVELRPAQEKHFGRFRRILLGPLPSAEARRLIRQAAAGAEVEDWQLLQTHLYHQTGGHPRAILDSVALLRKEPAVTRQAVRSVTPSAGDPEIDLSPAIILVVLGLIGYRFIARGLGDLELYVFAGVGSVLAMALRYYLFRAR